MYTVVIWYDSLYYWFLVGEDTFPLHHLIAQNTPNNTAAKLHVPIKKM
jgi:hypothetical protein